MCQGPVCRWWRWCRLPGRAAAEHGGHAGHQRIIDLLRADEMDMNIERAGGQDLAFTCNRLGAWADDNIDARLDIRIAGLADTDDAAVLEADIGLDDAPVIDNQRVGDHGIDRACGPWFLALSHAVADHLAAAEFHLFAVGGEILLHLDDEIGIGQPQPVPGGWSEHVRIGGAGHFISHSGLQSAIRM
jgi:hypothetical protein